LPTRQHNKNESSTDAKAYICARCAAKGPTCCQLAAPDSAESAHICFPISENEQQRIKNCLVNNLPPVDLFTNTPNSESFLAAMLTLFPAEEPVLKKLHPAQAEHARMNLNTDGSCVCLSKSSGCILSVDARPWYCRIFPFWVIKNRLLVFTSADCLAVKQKKLPEILQVFSADKNTVFALYENLRRDWGFPRLKATNKYEKER
jgi:Fe-S-cluster containining protein